MVYDGSISRQRLVRDTAMLAEVVASNSTAALAFGDAQAAQETLRAVSVNEHIVWAAVFLKDGTGFRVLEACRHRGPSQKMVVLSNYATPDMRRKCVHLGADAVFDKATEIDDLIDYCLRHRQAQFSSPAAH